MKKIFTIASVTDIWILIKIYEVRKIMLDSMSVHKAHIISIWANKILEQSSTLSTVVHLKCCWIPMTETQKKSKWTNCLSENHK